MRHKVCLALLLELLTYLGFTDAETRAELPKECKVPEGDPRCRAIFPAWIYNETAGYCERLSNGGCYTTGKFSTAQECNRKCRDPLLGICAYRLEKGHCRANVAMYSFSPAMRRCRRYEGCYTVNGEANNFATYKECNKTCGQFFQDPCLLAQDRGHQCRSNRSVAPAGETWFSFDLETETCLSFSYEGCGGNRNRFMMEADCWRVCSHHIKRRCNKPISEGHTCPTKDQGGSYLLHGYNPKTKRCEHFLYKGCGGNKNAFGTAKECWTTCANPSKSKCVKNPGVNFANLGIYKRYYYDMGTDECRTARYFRRSNDDRNRFDTLQECQEECKAAYKGRATWTEY